MVDDGGRAEEAEGSSATGLGSLKSTRTLPGLLLRFLKARLAVGDGELRRVLVLLAFGRSERARLN
jgi:hypothetical protein